MSQRIQGRIDKGWGFEIVFSSNDLYCGKLLIFEKARAKTSMIFHKERDKSWFVNAGQFVLRTLDTETTQIKEMLIKEGDVVRCLPMKPHQLESLLPNSIIFEVSSPVMENDDFRITPGDTQSSTKNNS